MPKPVTLTFTSLHTIEAAEIRRRLDLHAAWVFRQFAPEKIAIEANDCFGERRASLTSDYGMRVEAAIQVADDAPHFEALVPGAIGPFAPVIEVIGRQYARLLFSA